MTGFSIENSFLSDDESRRLYARFPELKKGICPTCKGEKRVQWRGEMWDCDCSRQLQLAKHYSACGIGVTYQRLDWDDFRGDQDALDQVLRYLLHKDKVVDRGLGLLFYGASGRGKTMVANLILKELIRDGFSCFGTTFAQTIDAFTAGWHNPDDKRWFAEKFMHSEVLLLDDLGREFKTKNSLPQSTFDNILRTRVQEGRSTFLTTNMSLRELESGYGGAVLSLLKESSLPVEFTGDDFRPQVSERTLEELEANETRFII